MLLVAATISPAWQGFDPLDTKCLPETLRDPVRLSWSKVLQFIDWPTNYKCFISISPPWCGEGSGQTALGNTRRQRLTTDNIASQLFPFLPPVYSFYFLFKDCSSPPDIWSNFVLGISFAEFCPPWHSLCFRKSDLRLIFRILSKLLAETLPPLLSGENCHHLQKLHPPRLGHVLSFTLSKFLFLKTCLFIEVLFRFKENLLNVDISWKKAQLFSFSIGKNILNQIFTFANHFCKFRQNKVNHSYQLVQFSICSIWSLVD